MKNNLKTLATIAGCIILFAGIMAFNSQKNGSDTIMIRIGQFNTGNISFIRVYKGNGQIEKIQLEKLQPDTEEKNYDKIISTVQKYEQMGYKTISTSEVLANGFFITFILTKE